MMTDLDVVYMAVAAADRPISAAEIAFMAEMEREAVSKALHQLSKEGRITRNEEPNPNAGKSGHKNTLFVYTPNRDDLSPVAESAGVDAPTTEPKPSKAQQAADGWTDEAIKAAALRPASRWIVTPMGKAFDSVDAAVDAAVELTTSEGIPFAVARVDAVASVKVEIAWDK